MKATAWKILVFFLAETEWSYFKTYLKLDIQLFAEIAFQRNNDFEISDLAMSITAGNTTLSEK